MNFRASDFSDQDYQIWLSIEQAVHPEYPQSIAQARTVDQSRGKGDVLGWFFVEYENKVVGWLSYETPRNPMPDALEIHYRLLPAYKHLISHIWGFLEAELAQQKYSKLITRVYDNWEEKHFYFAKGFEIYDSMWPSKLEVENFDPKPFESYILKSRSSNIRVLTLADFAHHDNSFRQQWYSLMVELLQSVPSAHPVIPWDYETWQHRVAERPDLLPEGIFFALHHDSLVGISELIKTPRTDTLRTGLTAVKQAFQRKGIAQTLKLRAISFAKNRKIKFVTTNNHQINQPMLAINEAMGFIKEPALLFLKKDFL